MGTSVSPCLSSTAATSSFAAPRHTCADRFACTHPPTIGWNPNQNQQKILLPVHPYKLAYPSPWPAICPLADCSQCDGRRVCPYMLASSSSLADTMSNTGTM